MVIRHGILSCKAKIRKQGIVSIVGYQNVFRLEVPVEDPQTAAMFHGIQDPKGCSADENIIVHISTSLHNARKSVTFWTIFQNNADKRCKVLEIQRPTCQLGCARTSLGKSFAIRPERPVWLTSSF
jgi:hypothetical protein